MNLNRLRRRLSNSRLISYFSLVFLLAFGLATISAYAQSVTPEILAIASTAKTTTGRLLLNKLTAYTPGAPFALTEAEHRNLITMMAVLQTTPASSQLTKGVAASVSSAKSATGRALLTKLTTTRPGIPTVFSQAEQSNLVSILGTLRSLTATGQTQTAATQAAAAKAPAPGATQRPTAPRPTAPQQVAATTPAPPRPSARQATAPTQPLLIPSRKWNCSTGYYPYVSYSSFVTSGSSYTTSFRNGSSPVTGRFSRSATPGKRGGIPISWDSGTWSEFIGEYHPGGTYRAPHNGVVQPKDMIVVGVKGQGYYPTSCYPS
jgi:hypothetical protein